VAPPVEPSAGSSTHPSRTGRECPSSTTNRSSSAAARSSR
jgi:hypothetical protein